MASYINQFIEEHKSVFEATLASADNKNLIRAGFGCNSAKSILETVLKTQDEYFLSLSLLLIHYGDGVDQNRDFALQSLSQLHESDKGTCSTLSYIYAFCLLFEKEYEKIDEILENLAHVNYPPALAALGDWEYYCGNIESAILKYEQAIKYGHITSIGRHRLRKYYKLGFGKYFIYPFLVLCNLIQMQPRMFKNNNFGENCLYLPFYEVSKI